MMSQMIFAAALASFLILPHADSLDGNVTLLVKDQMSIGDINLAQIRLTMSGGSVSGTKVVIGTKMESGGQVETDTYNESIDRNSTRDVLAIVKFRAAGAAKFTVTAKTSEGLTWSKVVNVNVANKQYVPVLETGSYKCIDTTFVAIKNVASEYRNLTAQVTISKKNGKSYLSGWFAPKKGAGYHLTWSNYAVNEKGKTALILSGTDAQGKKVDINAAFASDYRYLIVQPVMPWGAEPYYFVKS